MPVQAWSPPVQSWYPVLGSPCPDNAKCQIARRRPSSEQGSAPRSRRIRWLTANPPLTATAVPPGGRKASRLRAGDWACAWLIWLGSVAKTIRAPIAPAALVSPSYGLRPRPAKLTAAMIFTIFRRVRAGGTEVGKVVPVLAAAALAGAVFTAGVLPMLPPLMNPDNGPSKNTPDFDSAQPRDSTKSKASAGSSEKFASRWLADIQKQPNTASISSNLSAPPRYGLGSGATLPRPTPLWAAPSSEPKKIRTVRIYSDGSVQTNSSTTAGPYNTTSTMAPQSQPSGAAAAPAIGSPASSPVPEGGAISPPSRLPVVAGNAAEAPSGKAYAVQVASERSAAEAHASFRTLQAKFPNQLGGREPIVSRSDLGADGIHYRAMVGPFASMEEAAGVCSTLKAAGGSCHVERD